MFSEEMDTKTCSEPTIIIIIIIITIIIIIKINKDNFGLIVGSEHVFVSISSESILDKMAKSMTRKLKVKTIQLLILTGAIQS